MSYTTINHEVHTTIDKEHIISDGIVMGRGVEYRYKLIQQHYESDDIYKSGESILHLQRREGIVGSLKVGACICFEVGF